MSWIYVERELFIRTCDKIGISHEMRESIKLWAPSAPLNRAEAPRLKLVFRSPKNRYEAWVARLPNPESNKGKSGGYRVLFYLDLVEDTINLVYIDDRKELGYHGEGHRKKDSYNDLVRELKEMLKKLEEESR